MQPIEPASWSSGNAMVSAAAGLRFKSSCIAVAQWCVDEPGELVIRFAYYSEYKWKMWCNPLDLGGFTMWWNFGAKFRPWYASFCSIWFHFNSVLTENLIVVVNLSFYDFAGSSGSCVQAWNPIGHGHRSTHNHCYVSEQWNNKWKRD